MSDWPAAPDPLPALGEGVHIWMVALDDAGCDVESCHARLSPGEQKRADNFKFARDRRRYVVAHAALRDVLARYTLAGAATLQFTEGVNGKPKLAPPFSAGGIEFNLSHSHETALVAVNSRRDIGVDIEYVKAEFDIFEVADHFFSEREIAALHALPTTLRSRAFYKCWTSKEAFLKAKGTGLSGNLDEVEITRDGEAVRIRASIDGWVLKELSCSDRYEAALVTKNMPTNVCCYLWSAKR